MRTKYILAIILSITFLSSSAQEKGPNNGLSVGFQLTEIQRDFGVGMNITSPFFADQMLAIRLRSSMMFNEYVSEGETLWAPYANLSLGLVSGRTFIHESIALYGEGGVIALFPSSDISTNDLEIGGYGLFGFEFYFSNYFSYYLEAGAVGVNATADVLQNKPVYSNGFLINVGWRMNFK